MKKIGSYINGNTLTSIYDNGTKTRFTQDDDFDFSFAENMDIKVCNYCDANCPYCLIPGTQIAVDGGKKNIEDIIVGDNILSYSQAKNGIEYQPCKKLYKRNVDEDIIVINTSSGSLRLTANHKIFTNRGYVRADEITTDDILYEVVKELKINSIHREHYCGSVYNIEVDINHNYFANNILVSNCHEGSSINGKFGDILNEKFIDTLHPYQEIAIGGGDATSHPDLIPFLEKLKKQKVIANITVNQIHFEQKQDRLKELVDKQLIYGIGVSLVKATDNFISLVKQYKNTVIHVINGIVTEEEMKKLSDNGLKVLILGYKDLRRGTEFKGSHNDIIANNQKWLYDNIDNLGFEIVSFDNLAIDQLNMRRFFTQKQWDEMYMGEEGTSTFYIDLVERKFAESSTAPLNERYDLLNSVDDMFNIVKRNKQERENELNQLY